ncbi:MAG: ATPase domain-containing protein [Actinomycetota bacterium]
METRLETGIKGLDAMLGGGLYAGTVTIVRGAPGTGKTSFGIEFLANGIEKYNETGLYVTFEEFSEQIFRDAASLGFDFRKYQESGQLKFLFSSPRVFAKQLQEPGGEFDRLLLEGNVKRIVVDSINNVIEDMKPKDTREFLYSFINGLRRHRTTAIILQEDTQLLGDGCVEESGLSYIVDSLIQLRFIEIKSALQRAIVVIKQRATKNDNQIRKFEITDRGIVIEMPFKGKEGLMSGSPRDIAKRIEEFYK